MLKLIAGLAFLASLVPFIGLRWPNVAKLWANIYEVPKDPPKWLYPLTVIGTLVGVGFVASPLVGLVIAHLFALGYFKPQWIEFLGVAPEENFFRNTAGWWREIHLPFWLQVTLIIVPSLVISFETSPLVVVILGATLFGATWFPETFDWLGAWNVTRWREIKLIGAILTLLSFGWAIHSARFEVLVLGAVGIYAFLRWKGWLDKAKKLTDSIGA